VWTSLNNGTLKRYVEGGPEVTELTEEQAIATIADVFGADPALYRAALEVQRRYALA